MSYKTVIVIKRIPRCDKYVVNNRREKFAV